MIKYLPQGTVEVPGAEKEETEVRCKGIGILLRKWNFLEAESSDDYTAT